MEYRKDDRVCPICAACEGKVYTLDEAEGMIRHRIVLLISDSIYTSEGWKPMVKLKQGFLT